MTGFDQQHQRMVEQQIAGRGITDANILNAFRVVPREAFVDPQWTSFAYDDSPLPIGFGQTISQPYIVALTIASAGIEPGQKVLEIGAGSGYAAALIGQITGQVIAIERISELAAQARERMERLGYANVRIVEGDGTLGFAEEAPFDVIVAAASGSHVPEALLDQLKPGGTLVMPIGGRLWAQSLVKVVKHEDGSTSREDLCAVRFVPLIGAEA